MVEPNLIRKKVSIKDPSFLQFFYPHFSIVSDLNREMDYTQGVIYTGLVSESTIKKLDLISNGNYIIIADLCDIKLETQTDFIKVFFPVLEKKADKYTNYDLDDLLPLIKVYTILQKRIPILKEDVLTVYSLYNAMVHSLNMDEVYFSLLKERDVKYIASSILSFLIKVQEEDYSTQSSSYKKLINAAHLKFGTKIRTAIRQYISSDQIPEIALWELLHNIAG